MDVTKINNEQKEVRNKKVYLHDECNIRLTNDYLNWLENEPLEKSTIYHLYWDTIVIISYFEKGKIILKNLNVSDIESYFKSIINYSSYFKKIQQKHLENS